MDLSKIHLKSVASDLVNKYITFPTDVALGLISKLIRDKYNIGLEEVGIQFGMNFIPNYEALSMVERFAFENVKGLTEDMRESLRKEMSLSLLNNEDLSAMKKRITNVMDTTIDRAKMIALTESNRANNMGRLQAAEETRLNLVKRWDAQPERISRAGNKVPCPICEELDGQTIELNDKFKLKDGREWLSPPSHPRCACSLLFIQREEINNLS
jgi:hypothetical protein